MQRRIAGAYFNLTDAAMCAMSVRAGARPDIGTGYGARVFMRTVRAAGCAIEVYVVVAWPKAAK